MEPYETKRPMKSQPAFCSLVLLGSGIIFFALAVIACAFTINYADDFQVDGGGGLEAFLQIRMSYCQYWAGIPFLITGLLVMFSGIWQNSRGLTITSVIFCYISVALMLMVLAEDSGNFYMWNTLNRMKLYWDSKSGYSCESDTATSCTCKKTGANDIPISSIAQCDEISELSALYGAVIGSSVIVAMFCFFSVTIITKSLSWKRIRYVYRSSYYPDEFQLDTRRRAPSPDVPMYRDEYVEKPAAYTGPPYKQTIYRNYPY